MTSSDSKTRPSQDALNRARGRKAIRRQIADGRIPTLRELAEGAPFFEGDLIRDANLWARSILPSGFLPNPIRAALEVVAARPTPSAFHALRELIREHIYAGGDDEESGLFDGLHRLQIYSVLMRSEEHRDALVSWLLSSSAEGVLQRRATIALGIRRQHMIGGGRLSMDQMYHAGVEIVRELAAHVDEAERADLVEAGEAIVEDDTPDLPDPTDDLPPAFIEDRAEFTPQGMLERLRRRGRPVPTVQVVPPAPSSTSGARSSWKAFESVAGKRLRLAERGDVTAHMIALSLAFPHARRQVSTVLRDLSAGEVVRIRPTLFVGSPGCGKTSLARAVATTIGVSSTVYSCGGQSDSSLMGTSAQWHSARPSVPLDLIRSSLIANPLVVLDEVDKSASNRHNGSLVDALLGFLEPSTSAHYRDLALEAEVDLSHVNWIATANNLGDVPAPLRDRLRIVQIEDPTWEHLGDLSRSILDEIARGRGLDPRWLPDLAQDELDVIKGAWPKGSLRKLRRALEVLVDGRDALVGRA